MTLCMKTVTGIEEWQCDDQIQQNQLNSVSRTHLQISIPYLPAGLP